MKNWLVFEQQRDAYILDGVSEKLAIIKARNDCRNNPYEEYVRTEYKKSMHDLEVMEGARKVTVHTERFENLQYYFHAIKDVTLAVLFGMIVLLLFGSVAICISTGVVHLCWNIIAANLFAVQKLTFRETINYGIFLIIIVDILRKPIRKKAS